MAGIGAAIGWGVKRGVYSNEAGQGTGPHAAAAAEVQHPAQQGFVQAFSTLRNAWEDTGTLITTNMPKARGLHMDRIREVRNKELVKKDIEFMKALEADDGSHTAIAAEKQVLRDIPQTFDLTTDTPEELKNKWPDELPR